MRRIILSVLTLMLVGGVANADRWRGQRGQRDTSRNSGGTVVRDHRSSYREPVRTHDRGSYDRGRRTDYRNYNRSRVDRRPVYVNNGSFVFGGGVHRSYNRPVFRNRYYDYRVRPQIYFQNVDPVPGYIWIQGSWSWSGYEWVWTDGYFSPDPNYTDDYYYDDNY